VKAKLLKKYGDDVYMSNIQSKDPVICFRFLGQRILTLHWYESKMENEEQERLRIVRTAAAIVLQYIRSQV